MRVAVFSDVHGNLPALDAVLSAIAAEEVDELWCLGDTVGYGPWPNECCTRVRDTADLALAGNHDLGVLGTISIDDFSGPAADAAAWTRTVLDEDGRTWLASLSTTAVREGAELFHASPRDPVWDYVLTERAAAESFELTTAQVVLVGHSHVALAIRLSPDGLEGDVAPGGKEVDLATGRWLLNPGSVGQPRDSDPRAAWLLIDFHSGRAAFRRVPYSIDRTQDEMQRRGLPAALAERLAHGI